jgi:hypothetical protein
MGPPKMIRITVSPKHPITIVAADERRFHFAQLVGVSKNVMRLRLRKAVPSAALLNASSVIIETLGAVTIQIGCRNISSVRDRFLKLQFQDAPSLDIRVSQKETTNDQRP